MKKNIMMMLLAALTIAMGSCKTDDESDIIIDNPDTPENPKDTTKTNPATPKTARVVINEVQSNPKGDNLDFVELYNAGNGDADLSGWLLYDGGGEKKGFTIPQGTTLKVGEFLVYECDKKADPTKAPTFGLSKSGDEVTIKDAGGNQIDHVTLPAMDNGGSSYARVPDGSDNWKILDDDTKGKTNGK